MGCQPVEDSGCAGSVAKRPGGGYLGRQCLLLEWSDLKAEVVPFATGSLHLHMDNTSHVSQPVPSFQQNSTLTRILHILQQPCS